MSRKAKAEYIGENRGVRFLHMIVVRGFGWYPMMLLMMLATTMSHKALWQVAERHIIR